MAWGIGFADDGIGDFLEVDLIVWWSLRDVAFHQGPGFWISSHGDDEKDDAKEGHGEEGNEEAGESGGAALGGEV